MDKEETAFDKPSEETYIRRGLPVYQLTAICASIIFVDTKIEASTTLDIKRSVKLAKRIIKESLKGV